jgi:hypothetical protein
MRVMGSGFWGVTWINIGAFDPYVL